MEGKRHDLTPFMCGNGSQKARPEPVYVCMMLDIVNSIYAG